MELYITGDTHGDFSRFRPESFYEHGCYPIAVPTMKWVNG